MIDLHFHWAWLLIAAVVIVGIFIAYPMLNDDNDKYGLSGALGCAVLIAAVLIGLVIGGIFIW
jgi:hypothetical protein